MKREIQVEKKNLRDDQKERQKKQQKKRNQEQKNRMRKMKWAIYRIHIMNYKEVLGTRAFKRGVLS